MVNGAVCSGSPGGDGSSVGGGLAGADDGGTAVVAGALAEALPGTVGVAAVVGAAALVVGGAVVFGAEEVLVGAGAGGPKQPVSVITAESPRALNAESLGLVMMPP